MHGKFVCDSDELASIFQMVNAMLTALIGELPEAAPPVYNLPQETGVDAKLPEIIIPVCILLVVDVQLFYE